MYTKQTVEPCKQYNPVLDVGFRVRSSERLRENSPTGCIPCFLLILVGKWEKPIDLGSVVCGFDSHLGYIKNHSVINVGLKCECRLVVDGAKFPIWSGNQSPARVRISSLAPGYSPDTGLIEHSQILQDAVRGVDSKI